ncbi:hypothetical protein [Amycolatopsis magusensis]|uniref:hypothetical protein n=1 Tax=Amycolatopsis magusensis TaxID=882444 RepID=UPI003C30478A
MDDVPPVGYHIWHAILQAMMFLDIDRVRWAAMDPLIAFAWAVQAVAKPQPREVDPPLPRATVRDLAISWLPRKPERLDRDFRSLWYPEGLG